MLDHKQLKNAEFQSGEFVREFARTREKNAPMHGAHEGYAVLLEEFDELWDHVKMKPSKRNISDMRKEAIQIGAMALAFVIEVCDK